MADVVQTGAVTLGRLDFVADAPRFLGAVPHAEHLDLLARVELGPQFLAQPAAVVGDHAGCGGQDVRGGAVILFEADDLRAREVLFELQDVLDLRAAP